MSRSSGDGCSAFGVFSRPAARCVSFLEATPFVFGLQKQMNAENYFEGPRKKDACRSAFVARRKDPSQGEK